MANLQANEFLPARQKIEHFIDNIAYKQRLKKWCPLGSYKTTLRTTTEKSIMVPND